MQTVSSSYTLDGHIEIGDFIEQVESDLGVKLMAREIDDTVHGYIETRRGYVEGEPKTIVVVHLYQENEESSDESNEQIKNQISNVKDKLTKTERASLIITLGGHATKLAKATNMSTKIKKLKSLEIAKSARIENIKTNGSK